MRGNFVLSEELREKILSNFEHRLRAQDSLILDSVDDRQRMLDGVQSILDDVVACHLERLRLGPPSLWVRQMVPAAS